MLLSDLRIFPISYECIGHNALDENKITADTSKAKDLIKLQQINF
jgi:hypothetical protein